MLTLVASALAGGDCIDDTEVLRTGGTNWRHRLRSQGTITLGTFLRTVGVSATKSPGWWPPEAIAPASAGGLRDRLVAEMPDFRNHRHKTRVP